MKLSKFLLFRTIYVMDQENFFQYTIRFGKIIDLKEFALDQFKIENFGQKFHWKKTIKNLFKLKIKPEILIDVIPQDIKRERIQKIKFFDRSSFMYHKLKKMFGVTRWIGLKWKSPSKLHSFTAYCFEDVSESLNQISEALKFHQISWGSLITELCRLNVFPQGEGLILAPCAGNVIREIYLQDHCPVFVRFVTKIDLNWSDEIQALKRHLNRYFHTNIDELLIGWWGPEIPPENFISLAQTSFQQDLVKSYIHYLKPVVSIFPCISSQYFSSVRILIWIKTCFKFFNLLLMGFLMISSFSFYKTYESKSKLCAQLKNKKKLVKIAKEDLKKISSADESKIQMVAKAYQYLVPSCEIPFDKIRHIIDLNDSACKIEEFFWTKKIIEINPNDYSIQFKDSSDDQNSDSQELVIGLTSSSWQSIDKVGEKIKNYSKKSQMKVWKIDEKIDFKSHHLMSALIHLKLED